MWQIDREQQVADRTQLQNTDYTTDTDKCKGKKGDTYVFDGAIYQNALRNYFDEAMQAILVI
jgi:hypothetical protein